MAISQPANFPSSPYLSWYLSRLAAALIPTDASRGDLLSKLWGRAVLVENPLGVSGIFAVRAVKSATAGGYPLLMAINSPMSVNRVVMKIIRSFLIILLAPPEFWSTGVCRR